VLLTAAGAKARDEINKKHTESLNWRFSALEADEQVQLANLMDKLRAGLVNLLELE
jgi:hypothetical protein